MFTPSDHSPAEQGQQEIKKSSLAGTIAKTALSFVAYGVGMKVAKGLAFRANVGIGTMVTKLATKSSVQSKAIGRAMAGARRSVRGDKGLVAGFNRLRSRGKAAARLTRRLVSRVNTSMHDAVKPLVDEGRYSAKATGFVDKLQTKLAQTGDIGKFAATKGDQLKDIRITSIAQNTDKFRNSAFGKTIRGLQKDAALAHKHKDKGMYSLLTSRAKLNARDTASVIRGRAYQYGSYMASIAAVDYGMYNITTPSEKKWYNPKKIADWAAFSITSDIAMRGAMPNAMKIGRGLGKLIGKGAKTDVGKKFIKSVVKKGHHISNSETLVAASRTFDKLSATNLKANNSGMQFIKNMQNFGKTFRSIRQELNIAKKQGKYQPGQMVQQALDGLKEFDKASNTSSKAVAMRRTAVQGIEKATERNNPNTWARKLGKTFGIKLRSSLEKDKSLVGAGKKVWKGSGHVNMDGADYNLSNIMPGNLAAKAFSFLNENISIGITKNVRFQPLSVLGLKPLINASKNKMSIFTHDQTGYVQIGPSYNRAKIDAKLNQINIGAGNLDILKDDIASSADGDFIKILHEKTKLFKEGKAGRGGSGKDAEMYKEMANMSREAKDLQNASEFVERYTTLHETGAKAGVGFGEKGTHDLMLQSGLLKLDSDDEFAMAIGNKMYWGVRDGKKNWKTFQLGYDTDKGGYHKMLNIPGASAEGLKAVSAASQAFQKETVMDAYGNQRRVGVGFSIPTTQQVMPRDAGPLRRLQAVMGEKLELFNKPERSVPEMMADMFTKHLHPKQLRVMNEMIEADSGSFVRSLKGNHGDLNTFHSRMRTLADKMDVTMTDKLSSKASVIEEFASATKSYADDKSPYASMFERFRKNDNIFITEKMGGMDSVSLNKKIKENAVSLMTDIDDVVRGNNSELFGRTGLNINPNELEFVSKIANHSNPTAFLGEAAHGYGSLQNKDVYNNLTFRTWFSAVKQADQSSIITKIQSRPGLSRFRKDLDMLAVSDTISTYKNIGHSDLHKVNIELREFLGEQTVDSIKRNKKGMRALIDNMEPVTSPSDLHDNLKYPHPEFQPLNVQVSLNQFEHDGSRIYTFGEQMAGTTKDAFGMKTGTVQTFASLQMSQALNAVNNTGNMLGVGFKQDAIASVGEFSKRVLFKRILPAMGIAAAYSGADTFFDESGLFEGTQLGEGLDPLLANVVGQSRLALARVNDALGVTATAKYLEDVMPGFVSSPFSNLARGVGAPLAGMAYGAKFGGAVGGIVGGAIGTGISILTAGGPLGAIGKFDISKSRAQLIEEYSGRRETPVYKGAGQMTHIF